ncbi:MAG: FadR/GntR family transcriptional regulator [Desulfotomaculaceae bacterium]|nr:FadR/GntR family transcriptional regulator [Desulfotomaculaceae bacterium]
MPVELKPIKTKKIYEEIIYQVKKLVTDGTLRPGDKLMSERDMAEQLQVGRSAVREAFRALEALGIIEIRQGGGTFIKEISTQSLAEALALTLMTQQYTLRELLELRKILEVEAAGLASLRHCENDLLTIEGTLKQMSEAILTGDMGQQSDWSFHYVVAEAAHNSLLLRFMDSIADTRCRVLQAAREELYRTPGMPQRLLKDHHAIFEAISTGRDRDARRAMYKHLVRVEKATLN